MFDKKIDKLTKELAEAGIIDDYDLWFCTTSPAKKAFKSGITEDKVKQITTNEEKIAVLQRQVSALMELLSVTEEHVEESDVLVKGKKKVAVKK